DEHAVAPRIRSGLDAADTWWHMLRQIHGVSDAIATAIVQAYPTNLEWEGDALLNLAATRWLSQHFPGEDVGRLTARRQCMVANKQGLEDLASNLGLDEWAIGKPGGGGNKQLANIMESLIRSAVSSVIDRLFGQQAVDGFLYSCFDGHAQVWFDRYLSDSVKEEIANTSPEDPSISYTNELDIYLQRHYRDGMGKGLDVTYTTTRDGWMAHASITIRDENLVQEAKGQTRKMAKNRACQCLLQLIQKRSTGPESRQPLEYERADSPPPLSRSSLHGCFTAHLPMQAVASLIPTANYKGVLQTLHSRGLVVDSAKYKHNQTGTHHAPVFTAICVIGNIVGSGTASKKTDAEQAAARDTLEILLGARL
ncbi:hypothetical protein BC936DRAFT_143430, partial [Jimgerdemannia flammicorona]